MKIQKKTILLFIISFTFCSLFSLTKATFVYADPCVFLTSGNDTIDAFVVNIESSQGFSDVETSIVQLDVIEKQ